LLNGGRRLVGRGDDVGGGRTFKDDSQGPELGFLGAPMRGVANGAEVGPSGERVGGGE
jgi:hypothetical protein